MSHVSPDAVPATSGGWDLPPQRAAAVAALLTLVVGFATMTPDLIGVFFDDAIYVLVAKAMAEGQGIVYPQLPGTPPAIHYPPLWSALLSLVWRVHPAFPENVSLLKAINPLLLAAGAFGGTMVGVRILGLPAWAAALAVLAATASVPMQVLTNVLLSEPLFVALCFPALLLVRRALEHGGASRLLAAGVMAGLLLLTRTVGAAVVVAALLAFVLERRWRDALLYLLPVVVLLLPWQLYVWRHAPGFPDELRGSYGPYLEWVLGGYREGGLPFVQAVLAKNLTDSWRFLGTILTPLLPGWPRQLAAALALALGITGAVVALPSRHGRLVPVTLAAYMGVVLAWPFQVDRFIWALWPLFLLLALVGARWVWQAARRSGRPRLAWAVAAAAALLVLGHSVYNVRGFSRGFASSASRALTAGTAPVIRYINSDPRLAGKLVATGAAPMVALYTDRQIVPTEMLIPTDHVSRQPPERAVEILRRIDARYRPDVYVFPARSPLPALVRDSSFVADRRFVDLLRPEAEIVSLHAVPR